MVKSSTPKTTTSAIQTKKTQPCKPQKVSGVSFHDGVKQQMIMEEIANTNKLVEERYIHECQVLERELSAADTYLIVSALEECESLYSSVMRCPQQYNTNICAPSWKARMTLEKVSSMLYRRDNITPSARSNYLDILMELCDAADAAANKLKHDYRRNIASLITHTAQSHVVSANPSNVTL